MKAEDGINAEDGTKAGDGINAEDGIKKVPPTFSNLLIYALL